MPRVIDPAVLTRARADLRDAFANAGVAYGECCCGCGGRTQLAEQTRLDRGWVRGEPKRYVFQHGRYYLPRLYEVDGRGCWIWQGLVQGGYGRRSHEGRQRLAHVVSYEEHIGPVPPGMALHHRCGNKACCNPEHLEPLTPLEHRRHHAPKLTLDKAREIRHRCANGEARVAVARRFGVSKSMVSEILADRTWQEAT